MMSRDDLSDLAWRLRCKIKPPSEARVKGVADFSSSVGTSIDEKDPKAAASGSGQPAKDPTFGADAVIKTLYEGKNSGEGYYDWVDYPPKQLSKAAAKAQDRVAIKVYKIKDKDKPSMSGRFSLRYHQIDLQNATLVSAIEDILKKEDVYLDVNETATFKYPFRPLYFSYDDIVARYRSYADDNPARPYVFLLVKLLDDMFGELRARKRNLQDSGLVSFALAWTYFPKGGTVYSWARNCELLAKVTDTEVKVVPGGCYLAINAKVLRFDGEAFVWADTELQLAPFEGNRPVTDLAHYPLEFHADAADVRRRLIARGRKVLDFQGLAYRMYTGVGIYREPGDAKQSERHNVDGRVLIDVIGYTKHHLAQGVREGKDPLSQRDVVKGTGRGNDGVSADIAALSKLAPKQHVGGKLGGGAAVGVKTTTQRKRLTPEEQARNTEVMLRNEGDLLYMSPMLEGYALKNKMWFSFFVDDISPMVWNDQAYEHLVYDEQQKDLVLSFVENHGQRKAAEDVILGKGQGLIILLSGPPGTGKTLMAEAVADRTYRPLFYLQAEDLGINPSTLGSNIKKVFEMATEWNAVVLLDEADVFMAERNPNDIARNELVSIFLRELEYFRGIIFLTTNLYSTIDSAFRSRVSLHLLFKPLAPAARLLVWQKFLDRLPPQDGGSDSRVTDVTDEKDAATVEPAGKDVKGKGVAVATASTAPSVLTEDDLAELSLWQLNGREIKNAVKMVRAWCDNKDYQMTLARLESGIKVTSPHAGKQGGAASRDADDLYD